MPPVDGEDVDTDLRLQPVELDENQPGADAFQYATYPVVTPLLVSVPRGYVILSRVSHPSKSMARMADRPSATENRLMVPNPGDVAHVRVTSPLLRVYEPSGLVTNVGRVVTLLTSQSTGEDAVARVAESSARTDSLAFGILDDKERTIKPSGNASMILLEALLVGL
jgi:hypothetical protein